MNKRGYICGYLNKEAEDVNLNRPATTYKEVLRKYWQLFSDTVASGYGHTVRDFKNAELLPIPTKEEIISAVDPITNVRPLSGPPITHDIEQKKALVDWKKDREIRTQEIANPYYNPKQKKR